MNYIVIAQVIVSIVLIISVLLQKQSSSASGLFGGTGESYYSRRGIEKTLFYFSIVFSILFLSLGIVILRLGAVDILT